MWQGHTCKGLSYQSPWVTEISDVHLTMSTTSLLSGKPPVASLLWIRDPLTLTSKEVLRPTFPLTIAPENGKLLLKHPKKTLGSINCCVCLSGRLFFFCYKMTHPGRPPEWPTGGPACGRRTLRTRNTQYGPQPFLYENLFSIQCKCHRALDDWFHSTALLLLQWWCWWFLKLEITQVAAFLSHRVQCVNC